MARDGGSRSKNAATGRGSAEAIEKRRVARQLNSLLTGGGGATGKLDGRTEKRRQRLLRELKEGRRGAPLKPIEVVTHADELLGMGETIASLKKNGVKTPRIVLSDEVTAVINRVQKAYGFRPETWKLLGISAAMTSVHHERPGARDAKKRGPAARRSRA